MVLFLDSLRNKGECNNFIGEVFVLCFIRPALIGPASTLSIEIGN